MLGKIWKKLLLVVLIVACLFDITLKLVQRLSLNKELEATLQYTNEANLVENTNSEQQEQNQENIFISDIVIDLNK